MPETSAPIKHKPAAQEPAGLAAFTEKAVWQPVGAGWRHLHGSVRGAGASFEWHDFEPAGRFDWGKSFHPGSVEVCLNVSGEGRIRTGKREAVVGPLTALFYRNAETRLEAWRAAGQRRGGEAVSGASTRHPVSSRGSFTTEGLRSRKVLVLRDPSVVKLPRDDMGAADPAKRPYNSPSRLT